MFACSKKSTVLLLSAVMLLSIAGHAFSNGMIPETTVVVVNEADGEASIKVKNTDAGPSLLYSSIENLPEDTESLLVITPPVARVEAGGTQLVRFILQAKEPLKVERLKRVSFEGIPTKKTGADNTVAITVRQDLPVILHPRGLAKNRSPWTLLKWSIADGKLSAKNDSPYVVRFDQQASLQPAKAKVALPRAYILPGEALSVALPADVNAATVRAIRLHPATVYGFSVDAYDAPLAMLRK